MHVVLVVALCQIASFDACPAYMHALLEQAQHLHAVSEESPAGWCVCVFDGLSARLLLRKETVCWSSY